jgi:tRNA (guanine37-N1)-methyltransferase
MKIDILTLFPDMFNGILNTSIIKRAIDNKFVEINLINFRDYSLDPHGKVDDTPYGGGAGMVLTPQPIFDCVNSIKTKESKVILLTPDGEVYKESTAYKLSKFKHLILICGHYEGFDERIRTLCDMEISIGDYVLTGGEIPAMVLVDSITRLIKGVINEESHLMDSFSSNLLDYPVYTKPREYKGMCVPDVLLSGDHLKIEEYRYNESLKKTKERRPDLLGDDYE